MPILCNKYLQAHIPDGVGKGTTKHPRFGIDILFHNMVVGKPVANQPLNSVFSENRKTHLPIQMSFSGRFQFNYWDRQFIIVWTNMYLQYLHIRIHK